jgi:hypothetical protein
MIDALMIPFYAILGVFFERVGLTCFGLAWLEWVGLGYFELSWLGLLWVGFCRVGSLLF